MEPDPELQTKLLECDRDIGLQRVAITAAEAQIALIQQRRIELVLEYRKATAPAK